MPERNRASTTNPVGTPEYTPFAAKNELHHHGKHKGERQNDFGPDEGDA
jgi:hypothetical protein